MDAHASDGLAVESAEMGFVAGKEGLALVLYGGGEHRAVFFRQDQGKTLCCQCGRTRDVAKSRSGISIRIIIFAASAELLSEAHFNKTLIGDILSIGLLLDSPQQRDRHPQRNRLCGKF